MRGNKEKKGVHINLKGMEMGDPFVSANFLYKAIPVYAYELGIIPKEVADEMLEFWPSCDRALKDYCDYTDANLDTDLCLKYSDEKCFEKYDNLNIS